MIGIDNFGDYFFIDMKDDRLNPDHYKWGIFYFNREDPRVILPKRNQMLGWTLNFANPFAYIIIFLIILFAVLVGKFAPAR
jgi:uncharacterized membrane protein